MSTASSASAESYKKARTQRDLLLEAVRAAIDGLEPYSEINGPSREPARAALASIEDILERLKAL